MDFGLRGRNALVFGGTRGIGRAIANTLAVEGADVAICARNADQVKNNVAELQNHGVRTTNPACFFAAVHESPVGTNAKCRDVRYTAAIGG